MKIKRRFMFIGGILLIISGIIRIIEAILEANSIISVMLFIFASIFMLIDLWQYGKKNNKK